MIEWDDGLSVGVQVLDDEHKNLLEIINRLSAAMCDFSTKDVLEEMFNELKESFESHAKNETLVLKKCSYSNLDEHIEHHNHLLNEVEQLKSKILNAEGYLDAQLVNKTLMELLLKHIIVEDMPLVKVFQECDLIKDSSYKSKFERLVLKTTDTFSFTKRLLLSALIPLIGMLVLGFIVLFNDYYKYVKIKTTFNISSIIGNVNELAHNIQVERGLSSGFLTSKEDKFKDELNNQNTLVDNAIKLFEAKLHTVDSNKITTIQPYINSFKSDIKSLEDIRKRVNDKNISQADVIDFYTKIIKNILNITSKIALFNHNEKISLSISSLSSILQFKEALGQERAYSTMIIEQKNMSSQEYIRFIELLTIQNEYLNAFEQTASIAQKHAKETFINKSTTSRVTSYRTHIKDGNLQGLDSEIWFKYITDLINNVKLLEDKLLDETHILLHNNMRETVTGSVLFFFYTFLIFITTVFLLFLFERSSKEQISHIIEAITHLAKDGKNIKFASSTINKEIQQMNDAYETTRQKLLIGNMYTKLYMIQKEAALKKEQTQKLVLEEMAFVDPLTGAVNRRKFEELSEQERNRSIRYKNSLSFLILDIDYFKKINDTYGHAAGDDILKHFVKICKEMARNLDIVARIGGEEFAIVLPQTDKDGAYLFAERLRKKVFNSTVISEKHAIKYNISIGIAVLNIDNDESIKATLQKADQALYEAKSRGRNRSVTYSKKLDV